jgi:hypothetical protein
MLGWTFLSDGDVKYVEHSGSALGQTREELNDLERRMSALGSVAPQQMIRPAESAEAKRIDKSEKDAVVKSPARSWVDSMEMALQFHANFYRKEPTGGSIFINDDYEDVVLDATMIKVYSATWSRRTRWTSKPCTPSSRIAWRSSGGC